MLRIGYFSRISQVPVKTLRYYDEIGLLKPAQVDRFTDYRYYTFDQLPQLHCILALKEVGLSLEQIRQMLNDRLTREQVQGMLRLRQVELAEQLQQTQAQLVRVATRLKLLEKESPMSQHEVVLKPVEALPVAYQHCTIPADQESISPIGSAFAEIYYYLETQAVRLAGPGLTLWHTPPFAQEGEEAEVAVPIEGAFQATERIKSQLLPASQVASVVHHGLFDATFGEAYYTILQWIEANGYRIIGPFREIYLHYAADDAQASTTELQFPIEKV